MALPPGSRLGPYEVLSPLGAGGMGEVYRARDTRLGRDVAIKILHSQDPEQLRRFEREARATSALNHPNIVVVHDVGTEAGTAYVVYELLEGQTLRERLAEGPLPLSKTVAFGAQVASALAAAHEKGIVHRDLKPENIIVTQAGAAKVLDFGLAKVAPRAEETDLDVAPTRTMLTEVGTVMGTVGYMAPEQLRGEPADARSDLFSFGAILYEMAAGQRAFRGKSSIETSSAILRDDPPPLPPDLASTPLGGVIRRCLEKSPAERFQSARDLAFALEQSPGPFSGRPPAAAAPPRRRALRPVLAGALVVVLAVIAGLNARWIRSRLGMAGGEPIRSIAVLPLQNLTGDPGQDYFADGMTEALTASLSQIRSVNVISRTSAMAFKDSKKPLREIARDLHADAIVEGSVARSGDRVRVTAQLIRARTDTHFWAKNFEKTLGDVLLLQGEIAQAIADQIEARLTDDERTRLKAARPVAAKAYEANLLGRYALNQGTEQSLREAYTQFQRALGIESDYAAPYAGLATYYAALPFYSTRSPAEVFPLARAAAEKAVQLDEGLAEGHASLAYIRAYYEWDWVAAEREFKRALDLSPNFADAHFSYSRFLAAAGRMDEAMAEIHRVEELDPQSLSLRTNTAILAYFQNRYDDALAQLEAIHHADSTLSIVWWGLGLCYEQKGMRPEALASLESAAKLSTGSQNYEASLAHAYGRFGNPAKAREILARMTEQARKGYVPSYFFVIVYAGLGEKDRAFEMLERTYQERSTVLAYLRLDPRLAPLRSDPRYGDLVRRLGFPS